jgi:hypothetical protein
MILKLASFFVVYGFWIGFMGLGQFIYDYQTLLTGIGAVSAAYIAAKPVWRQLELTQTQSNGVLREMLLQRQTEVEQAFSAVSDKLGRPLNNLSILFYDLDDEQITEMQAHAHDQAISHGLSWYRDFYKWRDSAEIDTARSKLVVKLESLTRILSDIHGPAHTDQHDENRSISNQVWAEFLARGHAAKAEVEDALSEAETAKSAVADAMKLEIAAIGSRLKALDKALMSN